MVSEHFGEKCGTCGQPSLWSTHEWISDDNPLLDVLRVYRKRSRTLYRLSSTSWRTVCLGEDFHGSWEEVIDIKYANFRCVKYRPSHYLPTIPTAVQHCYPANTLRMRNKCASVITCISAHAGVLTALN